MAKGDRKVPDINSSSTADIAFLLLIFFLITTSMDIDRGLARRLPEPPDGSDTQIVVKERNVLPVFLNANDQLMAGRSYIHVAELREIAKEFIKNPYNDEALPEKHEKDIGLLGKQMITENHVISLLNDRGSSYHAYMDVQNELVAAYNELRDELAQEHWRKNYDELNEDQQRAVRDYYPQRISEAEPKNYGGK